MRNESNENNAHVGVILGRFNIVDFDVRFELDEAYSTPYERGEHDETERRDASSLPGYRFQA